MHVVRQIPQSDFDFRAQSPHRPENQIAGQLRLHAEDMLDTAPYPRTGSIPLLLPIIQFPVTAPFPLEMFPVTAAFKFGKIVCRAVC